MRPVHPPLRAASLALLGLGAAGLLALGAACSDPEVSSLGENLRGSFLDCQENEIKFLATKHNMQPVFEPCGKNDLRAYTWSPDGTRVYFQLAQTALVMNADAPDRKVTTVPTASPIGEAGWLSATQLAIPIEPATAGGPNRLALFDVEQQSVFTRDLPHARVERAWRGSSPDQILLVVADAADSPRKVMALDPNDGTVSRALPWLQPGFDTLTIAHRAGAAVVGRGGTVTVHGLDDGAVRHTVSPALRGTLHPDGRWLAVEHAGEPLSVFYQRAWDDMTEAQRAREQKRAEQLAAGLPKEYPIEVSPPTLSFVDLVDGARFKMTSMYGDRFEWYTAHSYWASFMFWGFEGKQFRRNVLLGQMGTRLQATEQGREFLGIEPMNEIARTRGAPDGSAPAPGSESPPAPAP